MQRAGKPKRLGVDAAKAKETDKAGSTCKKKLSTSRIQAATVHKLTKQQAAELLKAFWAALLENDERQVRKMLVAHGRSVDFRAARYAPAADGSALHLCAQHGLVSMAQLLVEFQAAELDAPNKVGSTPLHVACKFGQDALLRWLRGLGARVDIPDSQNRIAFDVAPFAVVDRCVVDPMRARRREAQQENDALREQLASASAAMEDALRERSNAEMARAEAESRAAVERQLLAETRKVDAEWRGRVQRGREELEIQRAAYRQHVATLESSRERVDAARELLMRSIEQDRQAAQGELDQLSRRVREAEDALEAEQQELDDQLGLLEAANALPNDPDVQEWVLTAVVALLQDAERSPASGDRVTRFLAREQVARVMLNVLARFSTTRRLQRCALESLSALLAHVSTILETRRVFESERRMLHGFLDGFFVRKTAKSSVLTLCRDALARNESDVEMHALVAAVLYRLLRVRPSAHAPVAALRFSHERRNQTLPLDMLLLFEQSRRVGANQWADEAWANAVRDAAFLLFTVAKANATKALVARGAVSSAVSWVEQLAAMSPRSDRDADARLAAVQYLLGALSLLHAVAWVPTASVTVVVTATGERGSHPSPCLLEDVHPWTASGVRTLLAAVSPMLQALKTTKDGDPRAELLLVGFWTLKLLRNLALHHGQAARAVRVELFALDTFALLSQTATALLRVSMSYRRDYLPELADGGPSVEDAAEANAPSVSASVGVWLDLAEAVWIRHYDADGKLRATIDAAAEHVLSLVSWLATRLDGVCSSDAALAAYSRALGSLALVLSNDRNARLLRPHHAVVDEATRAFLRWALALGSGVDSVAGSEVPKAHGDDNDDCGGVSAAALFEALAHVLRVYLSSLGDQRSERLNDDQESRTATTRALHDRCRAAGVCAVLRAFREPDDDQREPSERLDDRGNGGPLASMKRRRAGDKRATPLSDSEARRVLRAQSRAVAELAHCTC